MIRLVSAMVFIALISGCSTIPVEQVTPSYKPSVSEAVVVFEVDVEHVENTSITMTSFEDSLSSDVITSPDYGRWKLFQDDAKGYYYLKFPLGKDQYYGVIEVFEDFAEGEANTTGEVYKKEILSFICRDKAPIFEAPKKSGVYYLGKLTIDQESNGSNVVQITLPKSNTIKIPTMDAPLTLLPLKIYKKSFNCTNNITIY